jgi:hypothetical protein
MIRLTTLLAAMLLASSAQAQIGCHGCNLPQSTFILPPAKFDHAYDGKLTVISVNSDTALRVACRWPGTSHSEKFACAERGIGRCVIYLHEDEFRRLGWNRETVLRHEIGHCNGWEEDHAGAVKITLTPPRKRLLGIF